MRGGYCRAVMLALSLLLLALLHCRSHARTAGSALHTRESVPKHTTLPQAGHSPLTPWLSNDWNVSTMPKCFRIRAAEWGIASSFNNLLMGATILQQLKPGTQIYYDHLPSYYQCSEDKSISAFLAPGSAYIKASPAPQECYIMDFHRLLEVVQHYLSDKWKPSLIWESYQIQMPDQVTAEQRLQRRLLLNSVFQALCPVVSDWWRLSPEIQDSIDRIKSQLQGRTPVIAIHARGGDKASELGTYMDSRTKQYPMEKGMQRLVALHPAIQQPAPTCIILGDDYTYGQVVKGWAQNILGCKKLLMRTPSAVGAAYNYNKFKRSPLEQRCADTKRYVEDIELMAWADFLIGNHRANGDTLAVYVRKCKYFHDYFTAVPGTGAAFFNLWH